MLKQQLQQKLQQKLSPQQIQMIRLLELPTLELEERVKHELEDNPALEEGKEPQDDLEHSEEVEDFAAEGSDNEDLSLGDYFSADDIPEYKLQQMTERAERKEEIPFAEGESLSEFLLEQLRLRELPEKQVKIAEYIIGNLDDDGYLRRDLSAIADDLVFQAGVEADEAEVEQVLRVIQDFEPAGIGARDLKECLLIQLNKREKTEATRLALRILNSYFEDFTRKRYERILKTLDINEEELKRAIREITLLNPKPGSSWGDTMETAMSQVVPDFVVEANNGELTLSMNNRGVPDLRINQEYAEMFQDYAGDETTLRPMILKDVAERTGYDISTISRVSNSKYVQTNFGVYPLKYFFSESMQTDTGEEISTREVKKIMKDHVDAEDKRHPLTDEELAAILKEAGYVIARRTVAKYREQLGIPVARMRKEI